MKRLHPDAERLLDALRVADEPDARDRDRVRARVLVRAGAAVGAAAATSVATRAAAHGVSHAGTAAGLAKVGLVIVASVCAASGAWWSIGPGRRSADASRTVTSMPSPPVAPIPEASAVIPMVSSSAPEPEARVAPRSIAPVAAPAASRDDLDTETRMLQRAQQELAAGDPNAALGVLAEHARRFPRGALAVERLGVQAIASCRAGQSNGRAQAERFLASHPSSPMAKRVRSACGLAEP